MQNYNILDNGVISIGINLKHGGAIGYLADSKAKINLVNTWNAGRYLTQAYYSGPTPFGNPSPPWQSMGWTTNEAGDAFGNPSRLLQWTNDGTVIYTKTTPLQWALDNVPCEAICEKWITLNKNVVNVKQRLTMSRADQTQYPPHGQETAALYTTGQFYRLMTYTGLQPWTNDTLTQITNAKPDVWQNFQATECWAALVDDQDYGVCLYTPNLINHFGGVGGAGAVNDPRNWKSSDNPCLYLGAIPCQVIDYNAVWNTEYKLILGILDGMRSYVYNNKPNPLPNYVFAQDRQNWITVQTTDQGWPAGFWRINLVSGGRVHSANAWWQAEQLPNLYINYRYNGATNTNAQLYWGTGLGINGGGPNFLPANNVIYPVLADGNWHTAVVNLAANASYTGVINGLRLDPLTSVGTAVVGSMFDLASVTATQLPLPTN